MADKTVWFITGAGRGMGVDIAQAALVAEQAVVATGRNTEVVADAVGEADDLLVVEARHHEPGTHSDATLGAGTVTPKRHRNGGKRTLGISTPTTSAGVRSTGRRIRCQSEFASSAVDPS